MAQRLVYSNYHATWNTNIVNNHGNRNRALNCLEQGVRYAANNAFRWLRINDGQYFNAFSAAERRLVERIRMRCGVEAGGANNPAPHVHILIEIAHRTNLRVDYDALRAALVEGMMRALAPTLTRQEIEGGNFHVDYVPRGQEQNILFYIGKDGVQLGTDPALRNTDFSATQTFQQ